MRRALVRLLSLAGLSGLLAWLLRWWRRCCDPSVGAWTGAPTWDGGGRMTNTGDVRAFVDARRPCWRHHPTAMALAVIGLDPQDSGLVETVELQRAAGGGSGEVAVTATREHEGDDSVAATRYRFVFVDAGFTGGTPGIFLLVDGIREFRCQPSRGHTDWSPELCV